MPTGRVSLEEFVLMLIDELGVVPLRTDWEDTLAKGYDRFREFRTWG